jgi:hypothetical protein
MTIIANMKLYRIVYVSMRMLASQSTVSSFQRGTGQSLGLYDDILVRLRTQ